MHTGTSRPRDTLVLCTSLAALLLSSACSDGGGSGDAPPDTVPPGVESPIDDPALSLPADDGVAPLEIGADDSMLEQAGITTLGGNADPAGPVGGGGLQPRVFESATSIDLQVAEGLVALVELFDESLILPRNLPVNFIDCGTANAFFAPDATDVGFPGPNIFMCNELVQEFVGFYNGDAQDVFLASAFVFVHELGHALVHELALPVLGIEESYVDGVAAVFAGEGGMAEAPLVAGFFFLDQPDSPWFDTHRVGRQRFGDLACWAIGAEPALANDPDVRDIADQLVESGRNCVAAYRQQLDGLMQVLDPHVRGSLGDAFANAGLLDGIVMSGDDGAAGPSIGPDAGGGDDPNGAEAPEIAFWDSSTAEGDVRFTALVVEGPEAGAYLLDFRGDAFDGGLACYLFTRSPFALDRFATDAAGTLLLDGNPIGTPIAGADIPDAPFCDG